MLISGRVWWLDACLHNPMPLIDALTRLPSPSPILIIKNRCCTLPTTRSRTSRVGRQANKNEPTPIPPPTHTKKGQAMHPTRLKSRSSMHRLHPSSLYHPHHKRNIHPTPTPIGLEGLASLRVLDLGANRIRSMAGLAGLSSLQVGQRVLGVTH